MKRKILASLLMLCLNACGSNNSEAPQSSTVVEKTDSTLLDRSAVTTNSDVIVQLFNWPWRKISSEIPLLASEGYGQIHVSPPNLTIDTDQWWGRYQPVDYRLIAGPLGNETEFKAMITTAHQYGIKIIVDIVFNHTANTGSPWPKEASGLVKTQGALFQDSDYHHTGCIQDYSNTYEVRNDRICGGNGDTGLPDLDQSSSKVFTEQHNFLQRLSAMGVDGYRFDAVKHMEPDYFKKLLSSDVAAGKTIFGEVIADAGTYDRDLAPYLATGTMNFYDFPLRSTIQAALSMSGSLATLVDDSLAKSKRALPADKGIGFVMNHDIPNNDGFRYMILEETDEMLGYAYLMGRSGLTPYVYSDLGASAGGGLRDERWKYAHRNEKLLSLVRFHNATRGTSQSVLVADSCVIGLQREQKGVIWINKCESSRTVSIQGKFAGGVELYDSLTSQTVDKDQNIEIPGRSSLALLAR